MRTENDTNVGGARYLVTLLFISLAAGCGSHARSGWQFDEQSDARVDGAEGDHTYRYSVAFESIGSSDAVIIEAERDDGQLCISAHLSRKLGYDPEPDPGLDVEVPAGWNLSDVRVWQSGCGEEYFGEPSVIAERVQGRMWFGSESSGGTVFNLDITAAFAAPLAETVQLRETDIAITR